MLKLPKTAPSLPNPPRPPRNTSFEDRVKALSEDRIKQCEEHIRGQEDKMRERDHRIWELETLLRAHGIEPPPPRTPMGWGVREIQRFKGYKLRNYPEVQTSRKPSENLPKPLSRPNLPKTFPKPSRNLRASKTTQDLPIASPV